MYGNHQSTIILRLASWRDKAHRMLTGQLVVSVAQTSDIAGRLFMSCDGSYEVPRSCHVRATMVLILAPLSVLRRVSSRFLDFTLLVETGRWTVKKYCWWSTLRSKKLTDASLSNGTVYILDHLACTDRRGGSPADITFLKCTHCKCFKMVQNAVCSDGGGGANRFVVCLITILIPYYFLFCWMLAVENHVFLVLTLIIDCW